MTLPEFQRVDSGKVENVTETGGAAKNNSTALGQGPEFHHKGYTNNILELLQIKTSSKWKSLAFLSETTT